MPYADDALLVMFWYLARCADGDVIQIQARDGEYTTSVYHKPTDLGRCINAESEWCGENGEESISPSNIHSSSLFKPSSNHR